LSEQKLVDQVEAREIRPANEAEIRALLGAGPGSLGAVGRDGLTVIADLALEGRRNMTTGANEDDFHRRGVDVARDVPVKYWLDLREASEGEGCPSCSEPLRVVKTIEVGHIFKLGTRYSEAMGAAVQGEDGKSHPIIMGSYVIGIERAMAAVVERCHDQNGIVWPVSVAPWEVVITVVKPGDPATLEAGERIYDALRGDGIEVLLDDRDERPGVKFKDADLIGIPWRVTVGPKGIAEGKAEITRRAGGEAESVDLNKTPEKVAEAVLEERSFAPRV
jgi:prolyl-tRNA synthetase